jgi:hypothetical protein
MLAPYTPQGIHLSQVNIQLLGGTYVFTSSMLNLQQDHLVGLWAAHRRSSSWIPRRAALHLQQLVL